MKTGTRESIVISGRRVEYRRVCSKTARVIRLRVGTNGVEVIQPVSRQPGEVAEFLTANSGWLLEQLSRVERFRRIRLPEHAASWQVLFRGEPTKVRFEQAAHRRGPNGIFAKPGSIVVVRGDQGIPPERTLENWLRRQARSDIEFHLGKVLRRLNRQAGRVYVMGQRTKWGNCSALGNLSFNWRLILAPPFVLQYLVTHEVVHLVVPDHSSRFWLTVRSLCPDAERAKQWLSANARELMVDLGNARKSMTSNRSE